MKSLMLVLVTIFQFSKTAQTVFEHPKIDFTQNYEFIDIKINKEKNETEDLRWRNLVSVEFDSQGRNFQILLEKDNSIISPSARIYLRGKTTHIMNLKHLSGSALYRGIVKDERSMVNGFFHKNQFVGRIVLKEDVYYLEMASTSLKDDRYKEKVVMYKEKNLLSAAPRLENNEENGNEDFGASDGILNSFRFNSSFNVVRKNLRPKMKKLNCEIELIADDSFVKFLKGDRAKIVAEMLYHVKIADEIFGKTNFDDDSIAKNIGFRVEKITILENKNELNFPSNSGLDPADYLKEFSRKVKQNLCLVIIFSHKDFKQLCVPPFYGGFCENSNNTGKFSKNIVFVTNKMKNVISRAMFSAMLIHGIGHAFGSDHDNQSDWRCLPGNGSKLENYLMHPLMGNAADVNWKFSPCSKSAIQLAIKKKQEQYSSCLKMKSQSKCGNAVTEAGEECDCGPIESCKKLDPCCNPPGTVNECTLRVQSPMFCSPREGPCCDKNCRIVSKAEGRKCSVNLICREKNGICDGISPFCPEVLLPDGTPCLEFSQCRSGFCIDDVCKDNDLESCECSILNECHVCCMDDSERCLPSSKFNLPLPTELFTKIPGTKCGNDTGKCLKDGSCSLAVKKKSHRTWWSTNWPILAGVSFTLFFATFLYVYYKENVATIWNFCHVSKRQT
ncbi:disintegrin and metalloproteinase domain-containing protein 10-like [Centruroides vittatus]|uniref:disintegrin and metalloproteinase domain-containing protein 10-like n=1 Tax=Centruroides vittatus TaxID=120091 RepID=UPI00350ECAB2